ncbi:aminoglycoside N(3)-acetyltransferase [Cellulomonas sp. P24]|uniref:aminoglycoside N(3)-acetyltransferase n=1 Tax=Cellulomonas sp. P24 TaxID=2885206 RepID=UPI00216AC8BF|nr:AAC(3) family N-acetyltransferase [Cellulomonas sp. P24]MCR6491296.1 AAC(3) family N-acetyltransferase [Cellulomonas sp. P24]
MPASPSPAVPELVTESSLVRDLTSLGLRPGSTVLVHTSLSSLGHVVGGEQVVIQALLSVVDGGTVVMPAQSWQLCDPAYLAGTASVDHEDAIRAHLPAYDPRRTPTRTMGRVAELFRTWPGAQRSAHPHRSFAALGPDADRLLARHDLDSPVGERSPLAALYEADADVLLLGVGFDKCTALHLAEDRAHLPGRAVVANGAPMTSEGRREWVTFDEPVVDDADFPAVGSAFARQSRELRAGVVGAAFARLVPVRPLVDFAASWFRTHRSAAPDGSRDR